MFVFWGTGGLVRWGSRGGGGSMLTVFLVFLGQGYFPFQSKAFFSLQSEMAKGSFWGGLICYYKKEQKNRYNMRFLLYDLFRQFFSNFENMYALYQGVGSSNHG